jgi:hypothetical protein
MTDQQPPLPPAPAGGEPWQPPPLPTRPRAAWWARPRVLIGLGVLAAAIIVAVVLLVTLSGSSTFTVHGTAEVKGTDSFVATGGANNECAGTGGYDDLAQGADVVVTDNASRTIAVGSVTGSAAAGNACVLTFEIPKVPSGKKFYGIEVSHRGVVHFMEKEMKAGPELSIGSDG